MNSSVHFMSICNMVGDMTTVNLFDQASEKYLMLQKKQILHMMLIIVFVEGNLVILASIKNGINLAHSGKIHKTSFQIYYS